MLLQRFIARPGAARGALARVSLARANGGANAGQMSRLQIRLLSSTDSKHTGKPTGLAHGGMPDFVESWNPGAFRKVGYGLAVATAVSAPLAYVDEGISVLAPFLMSGATAAYWAIGLNDLNAKSKTLRQNFPVLIHLRYLLESIRPEMQQYFIESDGDSVPFSRAARSVVYQRAKAQPDTRSLGTKRKVYAEGFEWANHSMFPVPTSDVADRVTIGGEDCTQPYSASLLNISAMSYGALSGPAVEALNRGAAMGGFYHNTGEGGISRFHLTGADVCWNVGTGYFGCGSFDSENNRIFDSEQFRSNATRPEVKMIEVKLSQGAKPAHGGILPASKITAAIAESRGLGPPPWTKDCVSPPRHNAFNSPTGLMLFIKKLKALSGGKPVGFKLCLGQPQEFCALVHAMIEIGEVPDFITVDGTEGGTGAAPPEFQDSIGMPLQEGLRLVDNVLIGAGLRDRLKIIAAGKVYNGFSLVRMLALGADCTNAARSMMFSLGCIQALKCNSNKCPTGITTQDPTLNSALDVESKSKRVRNFQKATVHAAREIIGAMGKRCGSEVGPELIMRRVSTGDDVRAYAAIGEHLASGQLIDHLDECPPSLQAYWLRGKLLNETLRE